MATVGVKWLTFVCHSVDSISVYSEACLWGFLWSVETKKTFRWRTGSNGSVV